MGMFTLASSFNQNLCAWKDKFPYGFETSEAIFDDTACTYTDRPRQSNEFGGPFCASDCSPTESPTLKPTTLAPTPPPTAVVTTVPQPVPQPTNEPSASGFITWVEPETNDSPVIPPDYVLPGSSSGGGDAASDFDKIYGGNAAFMSSSSILATLVMGVWTLALLC
jgi:hypothetical protein